MKEKAEVGFKTFEDLEVYKVAREFRKAMYKISHQLPDFENSNFPAKSEVRPFRSQTISRRDMGVIITSTNCVSC
jgi:hypothetical protein